MRKVLSLCLAMCFVCALSAMAFDDMGKSATVKGGSATPNAAPRAQTIRHAACTKKCLGEGAKRSSSPTATRKC